MWFRAGARWRWGALLTAAALVAGCADAETEFVDKPIITISGDSGVEVGGTIQLSASTVGGEDSAYTWSSANESVATVDGTGLVTAVGVGETRISAKGVDSDLTGSHPVVVYSTGGAPDVPTDPGGGDEGPPDTGPDPEPDTPEPDVEPEIPPVDVGPDAAPLIVPNYEKWVNSGHNDKTAGAFTHWDEDGEISANCAKCHSTPGYMDFIGADGSAPDQVDAAAPIGTTVECTACHNEVADKLDHVLFPSGVVVDDLGSEARCMTCHQGRASTDSVDASIMEAAVDDDAPSDDLNFQNIHYYAAGATLQAGKVRGGYQYEGQVYDWRFRHVPQFDTCIECHDPHSLEVKIDECSSCHSGVASADDLRDIRMISSFGVDYDGDGDLSEGIYYEIDGLRTKLYSHIQAYAVSQGFAGICYDSNAYPYWFQDTNGDGSCGEDEANYGNQYAEWTPRLLRGAYNYQVSLKDPGAFAHNAKYIIQLLYDSIMDLNMALSAPEDLSAYERNDPGHFDGSGEAARHWDEDEDVSASCSKCHGGSEGFEFFLEYGVGKTVEEQDNGLDCATCHTSFGDEYAVREVEDVTFPSDVTISVGSPTSNLCATCHSGRQSGADVDARIASGKLSFRNVHYLAGAATIAGADGAVGYQYEGKTYAGMATGHIGGDDCTDCHDPAATNHSFNPNDAFADTCANCHKDMTDVHEIRGSNHTADYDGDGAADEALADEIDTLAELVLAQMQTVADADGNPICYGAGSYPYWFADTNGSGGSCDPDEANYGNSYKSWTPALLKASFNYQFAHTEHGAWAHNFDYMVQLLIDSIEDLGGDITGLTRP